MNGNAVPTVIFVLIVVGFLLGYTRPAAKARRELAAANREAEATKWAEREQAENGPAEKPATARGLLRVLLLFIGANIAWAVGSALAGLEAGVLFAGVFLFFALKWRAQV